MTVRCVGCSLSDHIVVHCILAVLVVTLWLFAACWLLCLLRVCACVRVCVSCVLTVLCVSFWLFNAGLFYVLSLVGVRCLIVGFSGFFLAL